MKILIDTNILLSAILREHSRIATVLTLLSGSADYELFLTDQNVYEFREVIKRKLPAYIEAGEQFLRKLDYKVLPAIADSKHDIRDPKDQPILNSAIAHNLDVILTGDKDFLSLDLEHPECLSIAEFCNRTGLDQEAPI